MKTCNKCKVSFRDDATACPYCTEALLPVAGSHIPYRMDGVLLPAAYSFAAINEFANHSDVAFEELQSALLSIASTLELQTHALRHCQLFFSGVGYRVKREDELRAISEEISAALREENSY